MSTTGSKYYQHKRYADIKGNMVLICYKNPKNGVRTIDLRKLLSTPALRLWFFISDGLFDSDIYESLDRSIQLFLIKAYRLMKFPINREFELAISKSATDLTKRLKLLEGNIANGNLNNELIIEAKDVINSLKEMKIFSPHMAGKFINRITVLYQHRQQQDAEQSSHEALRASDAQV
jgi:hypothetical protein